jgi:plastocyanin domain-containing protein
MSTLNLLLRYMCSLLLIASLCGAVKGVVAKPRVQTAKVKITRQGYEPASLKLRLGVAARITFVRTTNATCAKEIVLPDFNIRRGLPLNKPVMISFTPTEKGEFTFACGMNMLRGQLIVQ